MGNLTKPSSSKEGFCCLAASDSNDFCGKCFPAAKAHKNSHCGKDQSSCHACGSKATWCMEPETETNGDEEGFCCMAAPDKNNFCGTCFPGAKAKPGSKCGGNKTSCHACGGHATWCKAEEGHCCMAAKNSDDFCGTCFPGAIAKPSSHCGGREENCRNCGGRAKWCGASAEGKKTSAINDISNDKATVAPKNANVIIHAESSEIPPNLVEGSEATLSIGGDA